MSFGVSYSTCYLCSNFKGWFATEVALNAAYPVAIDGNYAIVGATDTVWVWDTDTSAWVDSGLDSLVTSVFGRVGDVVATANDYSADQIDEGALDIGANTLTVNSIEIVGADGEVNAAAIEDKFLRNDGADTTTGRISSAGLTSSATIVCDDTTDSSSTTTGSIQTDGGLGVAKKGYFGDILTCAEQSIVSGTNAQFKALPATTGIAAVLIGIGRAGDGNSYIDFVSDTTYTSYGLRIIKGSGANAASQILHRGTGNLILQRQEGTGAIQCISSSGGVTLAAAATSWASISDIRKKTDLEILTGGLDKLDKINPYYFRYKTDSEDMKRVGVIAQEIQEVCPEAVTKDSDGFLQVKYTELIPMLISAIKELKEKVA